MNRIHEVLLVDDHRSFADLLALAVDDHPGLRCVGVETGLTGLAGRLRASSLDVAVVDVRLGDEDGLVGARMVRATRPAAAVVLLTGFPGPALHHAARALGAATVLDKRSPLDLVLPAIAAAASGVPDRSRPARARTSPGPQVVVRLTGRERQVLHGLADGHPVREVAESLGITVNTCRGYVQQVLDKLGAHSRLEAVAVARRAGLLDDATT